MGFGPYEVNFVDNFVLDLKNGEKISINVWFPKSPENYFPKHAAIVRYCDAAQDETFTGEVTKNSQNRTFFRGATKSSNLLSQLKGISFMR